MKTLNNREHLRSQALKERYLRCFGVRTNNAALLQSVVRDLVHEGIPRQTLAAWAVEAGYSKGYVASLLSRVLVSLGLRERNKGAGRKPSLAALELLAHARSRYGDDFLKVLRAAWRAGKAQLATINPPNETDDRASGLIVAPQLEKPQPYCGSSIRERTQPDGRTNGGRHRSVAITFKRTFKPIKISSRNRGIL